MANFHVVPVKLHNMPQAFKTVRPLTNQKDFSSRPRKHGSAILDPLLVEEGEQFLKQKDPGIGSYRKLA